VYSRRVLEKSNLLPSTDHDHDSETIHTLKTDFIQYVLIQLISSRRHRQPRLSPRGPCNNKLNPEGPHTPFLQPRRIQPSHPVPALRTPATRQSIPSAAQLVCVTKLLETTQPIVCSRRCGRATRLDDLLNGRRLRSGVIVHLAEERVGRCDASRRA
jgi:hypothetical protein